MTNLLEVARLFAAIAILFFSGAWILGDGLAVSLMLPLFWLLYQIAVSQYLGKSKESVGTIELRLLISVYPISVSLFSASIATGVSIHFTFSAYFLLTIMVVLFCVKSTSWRFFLWRSIASSFPHDEWLDANGVSIFENVPIRRIFLHLIGFSALGGILFQALGTGST